jgi:hypothetical protein
MGGITTLEYTTRLSTLDERRTVIWKDLNALRLDPDQPFNSRIKQVGDVGLDYGGAVSFSRTNQKGIIMFVARAGVHLEKLRSPTNETYLRSASDLIASAFALRGPRRAAQLERKKGLDAALRRVRIKNQAMIRMDVSLRHLAEKPPPPLKQKQFFPLQIKDEMYGTSKTYMVKLWQRLAAMVKKSKGAGVAPSPPFTIRNSLYTFIGVSSIFLILTRMNSFIDDEYNMELCPFGALMTLQYSLTAAPASQPMNAVLGQAISLAIAIAIGIDSISGLDLWLR